MAIDMALKFYTSVEKVWIQKLGSFWGKFLRL